MDAIVTDVDVSSAVAGLRALGRRGIRALAVGPRRNAGGLWSRYAAGTAVACDVLADPEEFASDIAALAGAHDDPVVYPGREESIDALVAPRSPGRLLRTPYVAAWPLRLIRDKRSLGALAREAGLDVPRRIAQVMAGELTQVDAPFPFVAKPAQPGGFLRTAKLVRSREALGALEASLPTDLPLLVQEYSRGPQVGLALVIEPGGRVVERFQQEVQRTWPLHGGGTSLAVSVRPDVELVERAAAVLRAAGYWGLAQLDLIRAPEGYQVIDVNPRFYTSLPLATACRVNLPAAWHAALEGGAPWEGPGDYRVGVRYRWLEADLSVLRHRWRPLLGRKAGALWDGRDPVPTTLMAADVAGRRVTAFVDAKLAGPARRRFQRAA